MPSGRGQQMCRTGCLSLKATPIDRMQLLIYLRVMTFKQQLCSAMANCASVQKGREQLRNIYYIKHFSIHTYEDDDNLFSKCQVQVYYSVLLSATRMNVEYDL
ncbi:hypothetical protein T11_2763 [Trichinella zimbabwensis]|uniref:Uncharacterized protein n=1 Tax=Trichinella zimbabwensis TaxID=268475 RepID=A0A0V1H8X0_9BILA|nr:hypothetical protein T11_2763 [Trichinella zimbabwensis]